MVRLQDELEGYLDRLDATAVLPGYAAAVHLDGAQWSVSGGFADAESGAVPSPDTRFAVYSITKAVTALAALRLAQKGHLELREPVAHYLDGWIDPHCRHKVRIIHLISHTAGFTYGSRTGMVARAYQQAGFIRSAPKGIPPREVYRRFSRLPRLYPPGEGWSYSLASDVLGWVLSEAARAPLAEVLRREVFEPLGMWRTCLQGDLGQERDIATVYGRGRAGWERAETAMADWGDPAVPQSGGASMVTTLHDAMRLASAYAHEDSRFLPRAVWRLATTNLIPQDGSLRDGVLSPLPGRTVDGVSTARFVSPLVAR